MIMSARSGNRITAASRRHRSHRCGPGLSGIEIHFRGAANGIEIR